MTRYELAGLCLLTLFVTWSVMLAVVRWMYPTLEDTDPYTDEFPGISAPREIE